MSKRLEDHTVVVRPDHNGTFVAYVPAIDGCHAWGRAPEEARVELNNVFKMIAEELQAANQPFWEDGQLAVVGAR